MSSVTVVPAALEGFAAANATMATAVGTAGTINSAANTAAMVPVFGLIGQEFLAAFIVAQANHLFSVGSLAAVHAATAASTVSALAQFDAVDAASAATLQVDPAATLQVDPAATLQVDPAATLQIDPAATLQVDS